MKNVRMQGETGWKMMMLILIQDSGEIMNS